MANTPVGGPFGDLTISPGVIYDGIDDVYGDGVITVDGYGPEAGGAAENVLIGYDGSEFVAGAAYNTTLSGSSFTDAFGATTEYYATQYVYSGGLALSTTIEFNGSQNLNIGGTASSTTVDSGGAQYINSGGAASSTTVDSAAPVYRGWRGYQHERVRRWRPVYREWRSYRHGGGGR